MTHLATPRAREFSLSGTEYRTIRDRIYDMAGIQLGDHKQDLVYSRLTKRLRQLNLKDFSSYLDFIDSPDGQGEVELMLNALTTNLTSFFREGHHFDHLVNEALPSWFDGRRNRDRRLRIWSSACSTGEEPYSIAMSLLESGVDISQVDALILATDLNTDVLRQASAARYSPSAISKCPPTYRAYFQTVSETAVEVRASVRNLIRFKQMNLLGKWPMKGPFDVIFCRNVLIYFDNQSKTRLIDRFVDILRPGGWLYLGHSESASGAHPALEPSGRTVYRKRS